MDVSTDKHLFWIAKEALKAPLTANWKPAKTENGEILYYNIETKELKREHPCDDHYKK